MFKFKVFISVLAIFILVTLKTFYQPVITNYAALSQLDDTPQSAATLPMMQSFWQHAWLILVVAIILLFIPNIKRWVKSYGKSN